MVTLDADTPKEVRMILEEHGLPHNDISLSDGFANLVVLTPFHVVRLNEGRFPQAFEYEARVLEQLPSSIPHPAVTAYGGRKPGGEYLILERLSGANLETAWPTLPRSERYGIVGELAGIVGQVHALPAADWMRNPWVDDALESKRWKDVYHAPPELHPHLIESAVILRPDLQPLLHSALGFITNRMHTFDHEADVFIHTDLHFRNVIVHAGQVTGLVDFEGSRLGRRDVELDMLFRSIAPGDESPESHYPGTVAVFRNVYPGLFSNPHLVTRLEVYEALWHLVQLHHWKPGDSWTSDPGEALTRLISGRFHERISRLLDEDEVLESA